ncbi:MAG: tubulin/FtsZ family protein [Dehalococcoidia bacterium]|nr:tubulin/FtsZ family protein [Dehalococcoidia bacterium]
MKLTVIGLGQCGGRIAEEFVRLNKRAQVKRGIEIVPTAFAVNTDVADLNSLTLIPADYRHRILIGNRKTQGHGVGKISELGAEIAREDCDKVISVIRAQGRAFETDGFLLAASAAGGTGSGSIAVVTQAIRERYVGKPVFDLIILPFQHEESTEERTVYNTALCLKSAHAAANAVILVDNQRFLTRDLSLQHGLSNINSAIVDPFYDILCAGEESRPKFIGSKTLDAGDIMQTMTGWTTIGQGKAPPPKTSFFGKKLHFEKEGVRVNRAVRAMEQALSEMSLGCDPASATKALYLLSAPAKELKIELVKELAGYLRTIAPDAVIRNGDYPEHRSSLCVHVILAGFRNIERVMGYYTKATRLVSRYSQRKEEDTGLKVDMDALSKDLPSLL